LLADLAYVLLVTREESSEFRCRKAPCGSCRFVSTPGLVGVHLKQVTSNANKPSRLEIPAVPIQILPAATLESIERDLRRFEEEYGLSSEDMLLACEDDARLTALDGADSVEWSFLLEQRQALLRGAHVRHYYQDKVQVETKDASEVQLYLVA
jgi:hypothetical protein